MSYLIATVKIWLWLKSVLSTVLTLVSNKPHLFCVTRRRIVSLDTLTLIGRELILDFGASIIDVDLFFKFRSYDKMVRVWVVWNFLTKYKIAQSIQSDLGQFWAILSEKSQTVLTISIFIEGECDEIESRLPFKIFSTLLMTKMR